MSQRLIDANALKERYKQVKWIVKADGAAAVHLLNIAPTIDPFHWIPVSDRLPEKCGYYLTCDWKGNVHIFEHDPKCEYPFFIRPDSLRYYQPTHWMLLPEPPKEDEA